MTNEQIEENASSCFQLENHMNLRWERRQQLFQISRFDVGNSYIIPESSDSVSAPHLEVSKGLGLIICAWNLNAI